MFSQVPETEWSSRLILDVVPALLEGMTQQGRLVVTAATAKAVRNFLEKCKLSQKEVHSRHSAPPQRRMFAWTFKSKVSGKVSDALKCIGVVQVRKAASLTGITIEQPFSAL